MFDLTNEDSFRSIPRRLQEIRNHISNASVPIVLIGNKSVLEDKRVISYEKGKAFADSNGLTYFEVSAKNNINVYEVFEYLATQAARNYVPPVIN